MSFTQTANRARILNALTRDKDDWRNRKMAEQSVKDSTGIDARPWSNEKLAEFLANEDWSWEAILKANS